MNITKPKKASKSRGHCHLHGSQCIFMDSGTKLFSKGVEASNAMAKTDLGRMGRYRGIINTAATERGIDPALVAAIISRESRAGNALDNGWGDHGKAWGLMQVR